MKTKSTSLFSIIGSINYLIVVFLNAFTDLGHKIIIQNTVFKVYDGSLQIVLTAIINALILLPFILVFSPSGFLADRFSKNKIMQHSALFAIFITLAITFAYYHGYFIFAFIMTFLLALQSAIYAPAKYGYIKELFGDRYISSANGAVQAVTTVAILGGIIFYSLLFESLYSGDTQSEILKNIAPIGWLLVIGSILEWLLASKLPLKKSKSSKIFRLKRYIKGFYLYKNFKTITRNRKIFKAILSLGLFWSISQVVLAIFGEYAKSNLGITNTVYVQGVMALAGIGIIFGSILASKFSKNYINVGLVAIGAIGITFIVFIIPSVSTFSSMIILFTLFGIFSGFILVPLNALIQHLSSPIHLGTVLAGNNFIQNIFMFSFLVLTTIIAYFGIDSTLLFYLMGFVGIVLVYILMSDYLVATFWACMYIITSLRYKYTYHGLENLPKDKAILLLGNHVSWLDWIILQLAIERPINYMMDKDIYNWKSLHFLFKKGEAIPLSQKGFKDAFKDASKRLKNGKIVAIFPEGGISKNGELSIFHKGYELISKDYDGVVIPFFIDGMFGSWFAKYKDEKKGSFFKRREVHVYFGKALDRDIKVDELQKIIKDMKQKYEIK